MEKGDHVPGESSSITAAMIGSRINDVMIIILNLWLYVDETLVAEYISDGIL